MGFVKKMILEITGKDNKTLKLVKALKKKNHRTEQKLFLAEGRKLVMEAIRYVPENIRCIIISQDFLEKEPEITDASEKICSKVFSVSAKIFDEISDTDTPQGIMAVLEMNNEEFCPVDSTCNIAILDGVSEPGNMGTVIRTAEALGFDGIYLTKGCADIYSPKTVRSTMGSLFRMKFRTGCSVEDIKALQEKGFSVVSTTPMGETVLETFDTPKKCAVVIGNEAHGVCDEILKMSDFRVKITMDGFAESLNAAVAAGIAMHWMKNCRKK